MATSRNLGELSARIFRVVWSPNGIHGGGNKFLQKKLKAAAWSHDMEISDKLIHPRKMDPFIYDHLRIDRDSDKYKLQKKGQLKITRKGEGKRRMKKLAAAGSKKSTTAKIAKPAVTGTTDAAGKASTPTPTTPPKAPSGSAASKSTTTTTPKAPPTTPATKAPAAATKAPPTPKAPPAPKK